MTKIAIPIFHNRVSPVLDSCQHILLVEIAGNTEKDRQTVFLGDSNLADRCSTLVKMGTRIVICGGVSEILANMIKGSNIRLINGIAGDIDEVVLAFLENRLQLPAFYMPGFKPNLLAKDNHQRKDKT